MDAQNTASQPVITAESSVDEPTVTRVQSLAILMGSVVAGLSVFVTTWLANQVLTGADLNEFLMFWAALFLVYGIIGSLQQEVARAVGNARIKGITDGAKIAPVAALFGVLAAVAVVATSPKWASEKMVSAPVIGVALIAFGVIFYSIQPAMCGGAAAQRSWYLFAGLSGGEAVWRLVAVAAVTVLSASLVNLELAVVSPILLWVVFIIFSKNARRAFSARADVDWKRLSRNIFLALGSSAAYAVLVVGLPLFLESSEGTDQSDYAKTVVAVLVLMISITRSPIMMPLQAFQGVAVSAFLKQRHRPIAALMKPSAAIVAVGAVGGLLAAWIGPWLFTLIYKPNTEIKEVVYRDIVHGSTLGLLTFASAVLALIVLSGTAALSLSAHKLYVTGWIIAAALTIGLLEVLPFDLVTRVIISLYVGPLVGFVVHLWGIKTIAPGFTEAEEIA